MAKSRRNKSKAKKGPNQAAESRMAEAITVCWMMSTMAGLAAQLVAIVTKGWMIATNVSPPERGAVPGIYRWLMVMLFVATIAGLVNLTCIPAVYRLRNQPPPMAITFVACLIGLAPLVIVLMLWLRGT